MDKYQNLFSTSIFSPPRNPITLYISIPPYESSDFQEIIVNGNLILNSSGCSQLRIPCKFTFQLLPLKVILISEKYPLSFNDDVFLIESSTLKSYEIIQIQVDIPHFNTFHKFSISKISLKENESQEPFCKIDQNNLLIKIPQSSSFIHGLISVFISPRLSISFEIKANIDAFDFNFFVYNPVSKSFEDECYLYNFPAVRQYLRMHIHLNQPKSEEDVHFTFLGLNNLSIIPQFLNKGISESFDIDIEVSIINNSKISSIISFQIQIEAVQKSLDFNFIQPDFVQFENKFAQQFRGYSFTKSTIPHHVYNFKRKNWISVQTIADSETSNEKFPTILINPYNIIILNHPKYLNGIGVTFDPFPSPTNVPKDIQFSFTYFSIHKTKKNQFQTHPNFPPPTNLYIPILGYHPKNQES
jgi:hypothetical protein